MKLFTEITLPLSSFRLLFSDSIAVFGSCFADEMGKKMIEAGFNVLLNPFGTLYNPASIASSVRKLDSEDLFNEQDCIKMGAGADLFCSFYHHSSFARSSPEEFLSNANERLIESRAKWKACNKVIITLGSAFVWKHYGERIVSNCLKRPGYEFSHEMLSEEEVFSALCDIVEHHPEKEFLFTVSPIRHLNPEGAHANTLSKSVLHLGVERLIKSHPSCAYFPAYEILMDELRDYRFYASDLVHPNETATEYVWEKFIGVYVSESEKESLKRNEKESRKALHRTMRHEKIKNG